MPAIAFRAASRPGSSVNPASVVEAPYPLPFDSSRSTIEVMNDMISVDSSVCTSGIACEAIAIRSWRIVVSPPMMSPSSVSFSGRSTRPISDSDVSNTRSPPFTTRHPASTRSASFISISFGSW